MANEKELQLEEGGDDSKSKSKLILIIIIAVVIIGIGVGAAIFLLSGDDEGADDESGEVAAAEEGAGAPVVDTSAPAIYIKMKPEFIVNYQVGPRQRYLQVYMEAMTRNGQAAEALEMHSPMIRSNILRIMSEHEFEFLRTPEGRTKLRETITQEVRRIVEQESGIEGAIEEVLFTNFVMQ